MLAQPAEHQKQIVSQPTAAQASAVAEALAALPRPPPTRSGPVTGVDLPFEEPEPPEEEPTEAVKKVEEIDPFLYTEEDRANGSRVGSVLVRPLSPHPRARRLGPIV